MDCPAGLHFNADLDVCDWPESANCDGGDSGEGDSSSSSESDSDSNSEEGEEEEEEKINLDLLKM